MTEEKKIVEKPRGRFLKPTATKQYCNKLGRRVSVEFLNALDLKIEVILDRACRQFNGGAKTLDATVLGFVSGAK